MHEDFVSSDVSEALQEARKIVTKGKAKDQQKDPNLIEESTTVKLKNFGNRSDPVEVFISRSTKTARDDSASEEDDADITGKYTLSSTRMPASLASYSDSEVRKSRTHSHGSKSLRRRPISDNDIPGLTKEEDDKPFHTHVRYRRKQNGKPRRLHLIAFFCIV